MNGPRTEIISNGKSITGDHREIDPVTGQQRGYVVLTVEERAKGFVRPVRHRYIHTKCGIMTSMSTSLAETYARDPKFYTGTFCSGCRAHFPLAEFHWDETSEVMGS